MACSICTSSPEVAHTIDLLLESGKPIRQIAQLTNFHRSTVFRHKASCWLRRKAEAIKGRPRAFDHKRDVVLVEWPREHPNYQPLPDKFPMLPSDGEYCILAVEVVDPPPKILEKIKAREQKKAETACPEVGSKNLENVSAEKPIESTT